MNAYRSWIPHAGEGIRLVPCGRWWDAVQVPRLRWRDLAEEAPGNGVLEDRSDDVLTWLLPVGAAAGWGRGGVRVLGRGYHLPMPPGEWRTGWWLTWRTPPRGTGLTDPAVLRALLADLPVRCDRCHQLAAPAATITGAAPGGGTVTVTTCQRCADTMTAVLRAAAARGDGPVNDARTITGVCRAASAGSGPGWWHWTCPGPGATRVTATYTLLSDCACRCHTVAGQARLPEVPAPYRSLVPHDRHRPGEDAP